MIEFEDYRLKLNDLKPKLEALAVSLQFGAGQERAGAVSRHAGGAGLLG